jgi:hypothetical protein
MYLQCVISGFLREVDKNCALLGHYAASSGKLFPTFWDKLSVLSSGVKNKKETGFLTEVSGRSIGPIFEGQE